MTYQFNAVIPIALCAKVVFVAEKGSWLTDESGRRYLDFIQGWAVDALGHAHSAIVEALHRQTARVLKPVFTQSVIANERRERIRLTVDEHIFHWRWMHLIRDRLKVQK